MIEKGLYFAGYAIAHILFFGVNTPETVVRRLRFAYRLAGVKIVETPWVNGAERTIFLCPYRNLVKTHYGEKWLCHQKLDRVDDGYVTYLRRHKNIDYQRPRSCTELAHCADSEHCYSEVTRQKQQRH